MSAGVSHLTSPSEHRRVSPYHTQWAQAYVPLPHPVSAGVILPLRIQWARVLSYHCASSERRCYLTSAHLVSTGVILPLRTQWVQALSYLCAPSECRRYLTSKRPVSAGVILPLRTQSPLFILRTVPIRLLCLFLCSHRKSIDLWAASSNLQQEIYAARTCIL